MTDDIVENVLQTGKDGIKQNMHEMFDEFIEEYADEIWQITDGFIKLKAENAAMRERLKNMVELPKPSIRYGFDGVILTWYTVEEHNKLYETERAAEEQLAELNEKEDKI